MAVTKYIRGKFIVINISENIINDINEGNIYIIVYPILHRNIWKSNLFRAGVSCLLIVVLVALASVVIVVAARSPGKSVRMIEKPKGYF